MNIIFCAILLASITYMIFMKPEAIIDALIVGSGKGVELCLSLLSIYAIWLGILKIAENCGAQKFLEKLLKPIIKFLFGNLDEETSKLIAINLSANILGMGNASTPSGIKAMERLSYNKIKCTKQMSMLVLLNSLSLQIIPTTIIGLRIASGSKNATSVFLPIIIISYTTVVFAVFLLKVLFREKNHE